MNLPASIHARLRNLAHAENRHFEEVLQLFVMERFLYRLAQSSYSDRFLLKGALVFLAWRGKADRPTQDVDLLGRLRNDLPTIRTALQEVCSVVCEEDALTFQLQGLSENTRDHTYHGIRAIIRANLERTRVIFKVDIGFGDPVTPAASESSFPTLLPMPAPRLLLYTKETVVAEKLHAIAQFGVLNSRLKDYYDLWLLSQTESFEGAALVTAICSTFGCRGEPVLAELPGLSDRYLANPRAASAWQALAARSHLRDVPADLPSALQVIRSFAVPVLTAIDTGQPFADVWLHPGPWRPQ
ncbi:MAG: nucleotidyl transferase AbiEii/AbiGii toxin family protein [Armatimonadia bacterium]